MADKTEIEWTDATWNPISGCAKVSQGCKNCYAERDWGRLVHLPAYKDRAFTDVACHAERLEQPLRWKRSRKVFVNSMSDLFHPDVPDEFIDQVFAVMALAEQHTFQVLTKRADRMFRYMTTLQSRSHEIAQSAMHILNGKYWTDADSVFDFVAHRIGSGALPNVWLGVSVEDQKAADERIPLLMQTPAAVHWISAEPLLGAVDLLATPAGDILCHCDGCLEMTPNTRLDWVVAGGESGPNARPMHPDWIRGLRDQCAVAGVPFLFKQWGEWTETVPVAGGDLGGDMRAGHTQIVKANGVIDGHFRAGDALMAKLGKKNTGRLLDGAIHDGYPNDLGQPLEQ